MTKKKPSRRSVCECVARGHIPAVLVLVSLLFVSCKESAEPTSEDAPVASSPPAETTLTPPDQSQQTGGTTAGVHEATASRIRSSREDNVFNEGAFDLEIKVQGQLDALRQQIIAAGGFTEGIVDGLRRLHEQYPTHSPTAALYARGLEKTQRWSAFADLMLKKPAAERTRKENIMLVDALIYDERDNEALETVEPLLESYPENLELVRKAASAAFFAGDYERVTELLDAHWDALVADRRFEILHYRGVANIEQGNIEEGARQLNELVTLIPEHSMAREALGEVLLKYGEEQSGQEHLNAAKSLREGLTRSEREQMRIVVLSKAAAVAWQQEEYDACLEHIVELLPYVEGPSLVKLYMLRARVYQAQGRDDLAAESAAQSEEIRKTLDVGVSGQ